MIWSILGMEHKKTKSITVRLEQLEQFWLQMG